METKFLETLERICDERDLNEWIAYLASLKSINVENLVGRFAIYSKIVFKILNAGVGEDIIELSVLDEDNKLADYIKNGYKIISANNDIITIVKNKKLSQKELIEILREEIKPYRTLYLQATRLDYDRVMAVLNEAEIYD